MPSSQFLAEPPQTPPVHTSETVQTRPSSHPVPFVFGGLEHEPSLGLQTRVLWHWSGAGQVTGVPAVQVPA